MQVAVEREVEFWLAMSPESGIAVPALLSYRVRDPLAVHFTFHVGADAPVEWSFARDLLAEGLHGPCGHGDVRLWPSGMGGDRPVLNLALASMDGDALLTAPAEDVRSWLRATERLVAFGGEPVASSLDAELAAVLSASGTTTGDAPRDEAPTGESTTGESPTAEP
ncbi:hypothetical protein N566_22820 [Streptomycetaceae bacterium MP113-05]|nr:hypothetical protein N566_22820 [Streptomycetaceae bacterium MP113-05]